MGNPVFRFTLTHATLGSMVISEPDGWKDAKLKMERHPEFHSLVEYFDGDFTFYGENNIDNGGADFIRQVENLFGFDAEVQILIEADIAGDGTFEETIFEGQLDLTGIQEVQDNKIQVPIIRSDFWAKFIARKDTPVNLRSTTDLDGNAVSVIDHVDIQLTGQTLEKKFYGEFNYPANFNIDGAGGYIQFSPDEIILDEIEDVFNIYTAFNTSIPVFFFSPTERGSYVFDIRVIISGDISAPSNDPQQAFFVLGDVLWKLFFQINDGPLVKFDYVNVEFPVPNYVGNGWTEYTFTGTYFLEIGDEVKVYGDEQSSVVPTLTFWTKQGAEFRVDGGGGENELYVNFDHGYDVPSYFRITGQTTYRDSDAQTYLIHDAGAAITDRITNPGAFISNFLGSTSTNARQYISNGCAWKNILVSGLHIRGYTFDEKILSMSFMKWWKGANPMFNLGLGYDTFEGSDVIRVENKSFFYDATSISVRVSNVRTISREYDDSRIFNRIEVGFNKWQSENISGLDDPQSKKVYSTRIVKIDNALQILSDFIAASAAIEVTRRQKIELSKDYKYDNDIFVIAINGDDVSPDRYLPELDENFDSITGLKNSETRYNTVHTPARLTLRWGNFWNGCLQKYQSSVLKFVSGEGNYDMVADYSCTGGAQCISIICDPLDEKADINLSVYGGGLGYLHLPLLYTIEIINFTWDEYLLIRNNRHKAIGISQSLDNYKRFFIKDLTYEVCKGKCKIVAWPYDETPILVIDTDIPEREYEEPFEEDCGDRVRLLEDGDERITEAGECRNLEDGNTNFFYQESEAIPFYMYQESEATETYFYQQSEL